MNDRHPNPQQDWPAIPYLEWQPTVAALHLYLQIVGKYRLAQSPWINHAWHATFYVTPRGLTTSLVPDGPGGIEVQFDFVDHVVRGQCGSGASESFLLAPMSVADFHRQFLGLLQSLGGATAFHGAPNELPDPVPFAEDLAPRPYDAEAVARFHRAMVSVNRVFQQFRTGFRGKVSPVHLFWGSFDLAVTRFSGRRAPLHPGGIPNLPDEITQEAYSHEVSSAGFWPGSKDSPQPMFYSYCYPTPDAFGKTQVEPNDAFWSEEMGEFFLTYESVQRSDDPDATLIAFLRSTYIAAADTGSWPRAELENS